MAEAILRHLSDGRFAVFSAGTRPTAVHPMAVAVMQEIGIDMSGQLSKDVAVYVQDSFDYLITVCDQAREECPIFPGARRQLHWNLPDPAEVEGDEAVRLAAFRRARDDLDARIREFIAGVEP
jgi:arsenate reductase